MRPRPLYHAHRALPPPHRLHRQRTPLPLRERTAAHHFAQAGYATAFLGKLHPVDGQTHGFDYYMDFGHYYDYLGPKTAVFTAGMGAEDSGCGSPWITIFREGGGHRSPWVAPDAPRHNDTLAVHQLLDEPDHFESFVARETVRFLETYRDEPFFVVASFLKPHNPFAPPAEYAALYRPEEMPLPARPLRGARPGASGPDGHLPPQLQGHRAPGAGTAEGEAWARRFLAAYYGNVTHMDACAGRILEALEALGLAQNTLVLYTTDHGEMGYEHGLRGKFNFFEALGPPAPPGPPPGVIPAGARPTPWSTRRTSCPPCWSSAPCPRATRSRPLDGTSFAPALGDPARPGKGVAFGEFALGSGRPFYMRRGERWKYVLYTAGGEALYDPGADPYELTEPGPRPRLRGRAGGRAGGPAGISARAGGAPPPGVTAGAQEGGAGGAQPQRGCSPRSIPRAVLPTISCTRRRVGRVEAPAAHVAVEALQLVAP